VSREPRALSRWLLPAVLVVVWLGLGGSLGPLANQLPEVADSGSAAYLPDGAEATRALERSERFGAADTLPGVLVYAREGGITEADRARVTADVERLTAELGAGLAADPVGPLPSEDGAALQVVLPYAGSDMATLAPLVEQTRELVGAGEGPLAVHVAGPAGTQADLDAALGAIDLLLLLVTSAVILVILVVVYRSPLLPFLVLAVAGTALGVAQGLIYLLVRAGVLTMGSEVQGILAVLVLGCATNYALLLVARLREELGRGADRWTATVVAWRRSVGPILASASTVVLGLLCLVFSDLGLNADLGPAAAVGIACAVLAMLTFLPALLALLGRAAFWPRRIDARATEPGRLWTSVAALVGRRARVLWVATALVLAVASLGMLRLDAGGIPESELIIAGDVDSKRGQEVLAAHFPAGAGNPAIVVTDAGAVDAVVAAADGLDGVAEVQVFTAGGAEPLVVGGLARVDVTLADAPDSDAALATVAQLRESVRTVPGADAVVGGYTAVELDFNAAAERDRALIPLVLAVVFVVVALLLRSLVAPVLLVATVVLSFLAAMGVATVVFQDLLGFPGVDSTFPLHAFVFLVALGIDYNIFLMSRVREEATRRGTRPGVLAGLALTGGVITSAGVVLAATFAALAVVPLVLMVELAFVVAFGVLLDTLVVRSVLVPALAHDLGPRLWWPSRMPADDPAGGPPEDHLPPGAAAGPVAAPGSAPVGVRGGA
jgi:RND superfamily putative drug exporter